MHRETRGKKVVFFVSSRISKQFKVVSHLGEQHAVSRLSKTQFFDFIWFWETEWTIWRSMNLLPIGLGFQGQFSWVFKVREGTSICKYCCCIDSWPEYEVMYGCPVAHLTGFWFSNIFGYFALLFCFSCKSFNDLLPRFWHPPRPVQSASSTSL